MVFRLGFFKMSQQRRNTTGIVFDHVAAARAVPNQTIAGPNHGHSYSSQSVKINVLRNDST